MKVILLESVPKVGSVNEIVEVKDGYAMNYLIPQGLARVATEQNIANLEKQIEENKARDDARKKAIRQAIESIQGDVIELTMSANEQGTLFSAVSAADLAEEINSQKNVEIDDSLIELDQAIKEIGTHKVDIKLDDFSATLTVEIKPEE